MNACKHPEAEQCAQDHGQRQSNQQEANRNTLRLAREHTAVDHRCIDKKHESQREFGDQFDGPHVRSDMDKAECQGTAEDAHCHEDHWPRHPIPFGETRDKTEGEY